MKRISKISSLKRILREARKNGRIAFVPTMGAFHAGHLSLMQQALSQCDFVVVSLFVNPLQFGPSEDFKIYPRTLSEDIKKAAAAGVDLLWTPDEKELFPPGFQTQIAVGKISCSLEGAVRPDHFSGVSTIVGKFLQIIRPDWLYLGQKDYQQCAVIRQMMHDLHFETKLRICPTLREADGLAMSSRNSRLSPAERRAAPALYRALQAAKVFLKSGEQDAKRIVQSAEHLLKSIPEIEIDYLALCDVKTLQAIPKIQDRAVFLAAVQIGSVRLIDNILLKVPKSLFR